jgi:hypothetical protein
MPLNVLCPLSRGNLFIHYPNNPLMDTIFIILPGSDYPDLPHVYIKEALERLNIFRLVIGLSEYGGY